MKTIITNEIDGYNVVIAIGDAGGLIDPEATRPIVNEKIQDTDVFKNIAKLKSEMQPYANAAAQAFRNAKKAKTIPDRTKFTAEYQSCMDEVAKLQEKLIPLAIELHAKFFELMIECAVYFHPKPGDLIVNDAEAESFEKLMIEATKNSEVVTSDKKKIPDYRGRIFWKKTGNIWSVGEIIRLGDKPAPSAIENKDLSESQLAEINAQMEKDRIASMKQSDKIAEKKLVLESLASQAGVMKNTLEVHGDKNALKTAQAWLEEESKKVELKYA